MVLRKLGLVAGVLVAWLATFVVMGGGLPPIDLAASAPSNSASPDTGQGGPIENPTPIGPSVPTPTEGSSGAQASAIQEAEKLAGSAQLQGAILEARPKPRRSAPPTLTFRFASFNVLGSSHTAGSKRRASGVTRMSQATSYVLDRGMSVVGWQEMQGDQRARFLSATGGKWGLYPGGSKRSGDGDNSIAWRKDTWELIKTDTIPIPYFGGRPRNIPILLLRNKQTGIAAYFTNFHNPADKFGKVQHLRNIAKERQVNLFNELQAQGFPVFVTGDMNERRTWACQIVTGADMRAAAGGTGRDGCGVTTNRVVDWIVGSHDVDFFNYVEDRGLGHITDHPVIYTDAKIDSRDFPRAVS